MHLDAKASLVAALIFLPVCLRGQVTSDSSRVSGHVRNYKNEAQVGAVVLFTFVGSEDVNYRTRTDSNGAFHVFVSRGNYNLDVLINDRIAARTFVVAPSPDSVSIVTSIESQWAPPAIEDRAAQSDGDLMLLGPNYFISGFGGAVGDTSSGYLNQVKFRVGVRYRLISFNGRVNYDDSGIYATYSQKSFWHLYEKSAPFFENNYSPGALIFWNVSRSLGSCQRRDSCRYGSTRLYAGVRHESNGRNVPQSRGWNRMIYGAHLGSPNTTGVAVAFELWQPWGIEATNPRVQSFAGIGEIRVLYGSGRQRARLVESLQIRFATGDRFSRPVPNAEANVFLRIPTHFFRQVAPSMQVQVFTGFAESLLAFRERRTVIRVGMGTLR